MRDSDDRGAAVIELAMVFMFLMVLISGVVDLGRVIYTGIAVEDTVQDGAAYAAFTDKVAGAQIQNAQIRQRVVNAVNKPTLSTSNVTVACVTQTRSKLNGSAVTVTVTHTVPLLTPLVGQWVGPITISRTATAERFYSTCPTGA